MNQSNGGDILFHFKGDSKQLQNTTSKMASMTKSILVATGITKALSAGWNMVTGSMDGAISRMDTLNNFPKVMENLGVSADDSRKAIDKMGKKLEGLPTTLDQGAMAVQRFTSANGDVEKSTDMFLALNNAILSGGASAEIQGSALEQLSQAYAKGKPDMMEWRTLMTAMPAQLNQVAKYMGYGERGASALGQALREGDESMEAFMEAIMTLNTEGADGIKAFEEQVKGATGGIRTSIKNMKTAVTRGVGSIVSSFNDALKNAGFEGGISGLITNFGSTFEKGLNKIGEFIAPMITDLINGNISVADFTEIITEKLMQLIDNAITWITEQIPIVIPKIIDALSGIITGVANALPELIPKIVEALLTLFDTLTSPEVLDKIIDTGIDLVAGLVIGIGNALGDLCSDPERLFKVLITAVVGLPGLLLGRLAQRLFPGIAEFMGKTINKCVTEFSKLRSKMITVVANWAGDMVKTGANLIKGLWNGIINFKDWLLGKIKGFGVSVIKGFAKAFGIGSPSKLMADEIGQWIPKGISVGIMANADSITKTMQDIEDLTLGAFGNQYTNAPHFSPSIMVNNNVNVETDPLGQVVSNIKTFSGGAKNDYNYGQV